MRDASGRRHVYAFAGANGSGKSTVINFYLKNGLCPRDYICPDQLVPPDMKEDEGEYRKAMAEAERRRLERVAGGASFTFETVLSTRGKLDFIRFAQSQGYVVAAIYVLTSDVGINAERVSARVAAGGHGVPLDKIIARYAKAMSLMPEVVGQADEALLYDNSGGEPIVVYAKYRDGRKFALEPYPPWLERHFSPF